MKLTREFVHQSVSRMNENTPRIRKCLDMLNDAEVWKKPNDSANSIGNLILHLCGNITQYILSSMGGQPDERIRDEEFSATGGFTKDELMQKLSATVEAAVSVLQETGEAELLQERKVQGFMLTGTGIIVHVVEHYSYHTGQIALLTKLMKNRDLGFYSGIDLNRKNST